MGEKINKEKEKDWLTINMGGIFNEKPVAEGNVNISNRRSQDQEINTGIYIRITGRRWKII